MPAPTVRAAGCASNSVTRAPARASSSAAVSPPMPPPTTTTCRSSTVALSHPRAGRESRGRRLTARARAPFYAAWTTRRRAARCAPCGRSSSRAARSSTCAPPRKAASSRSCARSRPRSSRPRRRCGCGASPRACAATATATAAASRSARARRSTSWPRTRALGSFSSRTSTIRCARPPRSAAVCAPVKLVPEELERQMVYVELAVPDLPELIAHLRQTAPGLAAAGAAVDASEATLFQLARALQGLTLDEVHHALRRAIAARNALDAASAPALLEEKRVLVKRTGTIEYIPTDVDLDQIGGLELMKKWLRERRKLFAMRDRLSAEIVPKGVLVMGISGCGKSLCIKAIASCFELPLYRIDMIEVFSGQHGPPEGAFAKACHMLESMAPAVVWFDEIEAAINAQAKEGELGRIFGFFLTWMQEKTRGLFVGATANRIDLLPAEMIRKGRFDEVFFVDLPLDDERIEIFRVHLRRRGIDPSGFNLEPLKKFTRGWTGAEIEQCVVASLTAARLAERDLTVEDLLNATANV